MIAGDIHNALKAAGVPVDSVSVGRVGDKRTWCIDFTKDATDEQKAAAQAVIDAFDPDNPPKPAEPSVDEKLARIGLTIADLKAALAAAR